MLLKRFMLKRDELVGIVLIGTIFAACLAENLYAVSTSMDSTVGTYVQYVVAVVCVCVEALGLYKMREAFRNRKIAAAIGMVLLTSLATTQSVLSEVTFYKVNYVNKSQRLVKSKALSDDLADEKAEIEARLKANAGIRPAAAIEADIAAALVKMVRDSRKKEGSLGELTRDCTAKRADAYSLCGGVFELRSELASTVAVLPQMAKDTARLETIRQSGEWVSSIGTTHPGADQIADWYNAVAARYGWQPTDANATQGLYILVAMLVVQIFNLILPAAWFCGERKERHQALATPDQTSAIGLTSNIADDTGNAADPLTVTGKPAEPADNFNWNAVDDGTYKTTAAVAIDPDLMLPIVTAQPADSLTGISADDLAGHVARDGVAETFTGKAAEDFTGKVVPIANDSLALWSPFLPALTGNANRIADAAIARFAVLFCDFGESHHEYTRDLFSAYEIATGPNNRLNIAHFSRKLRQFLGERRNERNVELRKNGARIVEGLRLNAEGRKLVGHKIQMGAPLSAKDGRAARSSSSPRGRVP